MERYAVGFVIRGSDTLAKIKTVFAKLKTALDTLASRDSTSTIVLKANHEAEICFLVGVARDVPANVKKVLGANNDGVGDYYLPNAIYLWFDGQDYSYTEMRRRLLQWMGEQWMGRYVMLDTSSNLTGLTGTFTVYPFEAPPDG